MVSLSIRWKLGLAALACLAATAAAAALQGRAALQTALAREGEQAARAAAKSFAALQKREVEKLSIALDALVHQPTLAAPYLQRDRERLLAAAKPTFAELKERHRITHWAFVDPEPLRTCFLRLERPELRDDVVSRPALLAAIKTDAVAAGMELERTGFALRVVRPYRPEGKLIGYLELGEEIDDLLGRLKTEQGDELGLVLEKQYLDEKAFAEWRSLKRNAWGDHPTLVVADATSEELPVAGSPEDLKDAVEEGRYLTSVVRGDRLFARGVAPVRDPAGQRVGALFVLRDATALRNQLAREQWRAGVVTVLVAAAQLALLAVLVELFVFRRMGRMRRTIEDASTRLAGGHYSVGESVKVESHDEIGRFEKFLGEFLAAIGQTLAELEKRMRGTP